MSIGCWKMGISSQELNPDQSLDAGEKELYQELYTATIGSEPGVKKLKHKSSALDSSAI